jgi:nitrogen fixation protein FixH
MMNKTMNITQTIQKIKNRYSQDDPRAMRNPWVLGWIAVVVVFLLVNGVFITLSIATSPGLVVDNYYEQGRQYEQNAIKLLAARNGLRWETKLDVPEQVFVNQTGTYRFSAVDSRGLPLADAQVDLVAYRPSDAAADFTTRLEEIGVGRYQANILLPLPGVWDLNLRIIRGEDHLEVTQRIYAKAAP